MADLQELFARLKSPSNGASSPGASQTGANTSNTGYYQPSVSSPIFSPQPGGPQPHHSSAVMSPNTSAANTPAPETSNSDRTASLLNLLKFNQPSATQTSHQDTVSDRRPAANMLQEHHGGQQGTHGRAISASDLVASFMRKTPSSSAAMSSPVIAAPAPTKPDIGATSSTENPQDLLLRLLNHPKPPQGGSPQPVQPVETNVLEASIDDLSQDLADTQLETSRLAASSPLRIFGAGNTVQSASFEPTSAAPKNPIFTYVNPFEQLSASSPRNRTPKQESRSGATTPKVEILKHGRETPSAVSSTGPASKSRKLSATGSPSLVHEPREPETVAEALSEVGQIVDKQVEEAIAEMDKEVKAANGEEPLQQEELEQAVHDVATDVKEQLEDEETRRQFEESMPKDLAQAIEDVVEDVAQEKIADSWESAEDSPGKDDSSAVHVFNFPMKPFVSIDIKQLQDPPVAFRQDNIMDIARLKKDFDQIDRNLVTVSKTFIAYALSKHGGFRLIRQDTGKYKQVFNATKERIFNLQISTGAPNLPNPEVETILATGVDGSVFWTTIVGSQGDTFGEDNLEEQGFIFPPVPAQDDNTSGGQLKTRAKKSSRHTDFFGVGRGKSIFIVWPHVARSSEYTDHKSRICDSERYLNERCLRIVTGKAGKDFAFSEDDTVIASLDKAGRLRFWDIRDLVAESLPGQSAGRTLTKEVRTPILQLNTVAPGDKSWPTSVFFLDKERPCAKGIALRYLIVGLKQNHTLQLWDLGLGKPVQEINFPHENESDAICSIAYHPKTGILAVGHPTRNSIYFIHLSAPRYNLPAMSQAKYLNRLADRDPDLPRPESTAIMSGIREYSFASKGQLRSLEMLNEPAASPDNYAPDDAPLFELYIMHSKGVTCLGIRKDDLGWSQENKVLHPVDAEAGGHIVLNTIRVLSALEVAPSATESSANGEATAQNVPSSRSSRAPAKEVVKKEVIPRSRATSQTPETASMIASTLERVENQQDAARAAIMNGGDKAEKKKKKKAATASETASQVSSAPKAPAPAAPPVSYANIAQRARTPPPVEQPKFEEAKSVAKAAESEVPEWATKLLSHVQPSAPTSTSFEPDTLRKIEEGVTAEFNKSFSRELDVLHRRLDEDKRVQDAAGAAKMDAVLRLVSSTLTENVEKTLSRIVTQNIQKIILPSLSDLVIGTIERRLSEILGQTVSVSVPREIKAALPSAINTSMRDPETLRLISDLVSSKVTQHMDSHLAAIMRNSIGNTFSTVAVNAAQQLSGDLERRMAEQLRQAELQRQHDAAKIDRLTNLVTGLAEAVHTMSASQATFQEEILKLQRQIAQGDGSIKSAPSTARSVPPSSVKSPEEVEQDEITRLMTEGSYEEGTIMWLQSPRQAELFDQLFVRCNPAYIQSLSPLVALSVSAAVTSSLETNIPERMMWLDAVFSTINPKDTDILEVAPKIMDVLSSRLQGAYMQIAETNPSDPVLRKISNLSRRAKELKTLAGGVS